MLPLAQGYCSIFSHPCKGVILAGRIKRVRPDYVARHENEKYEALFINGHWYLYERRKAGNKSHKSVGRITEDGIQPTRPRVANTSEATPKCEPEPIELSNLNATTCEYGFSKTLLELCPDEWKDFVGARWKDELISIIVDQSPHSYLKQEQKKSPEKRRNTGNHRRFLQCLLGTTIEKIWMLMGNICLIQGTDMNGISALNSEQLAFCQEHHIRLEVMS